MKNNSLNILFASRLVKEKGVDIVIDTIEHMASMQRERFSEILWHFCSDGEECDRVIQLSEKYPNILYHGKLTPHQLSELYRECDMLLMPSVFLETFWLTALEALASGIPVCGISKGGLIPFITDELSIDESDPTESLTKILLQFDPQNHQVLGVSGYSSSIWEWKIREIFWVWKKILIIHDYMEKIWWAEYYVDSVSSVLNTLWNPVQRYSYTGKTSTQKRRALFITSIIAFWRAINVYRILSSMKPDIIWAHSILRYVWVWWILPLAWYMRNFPNTRLYMSHHDVWLMAAFPQHIEQESEIPPDTTLMSFIPNKLGYRAKITSCIKWLYIQLIKKVLPKEKTHIIFSPFIEKHIQHHFPKEKVILLPHSYDEKVFFKKI